MTRDENLSAKPVGRGCIVAAVAAVVATVGDLSMLYVANAGRPELDLPSPPSALLAIGAVLGVAGIPLYALGYRAVAMLVASRSTGVGRLITVAGAAGSVLGALIHGCTALFIRDVIATGGPVRDPVVALGDSPPLLVLWGLATALIVTASVAFVFAVRRGVTPLPRTLAWWNPAVLTLVLGLAGTTTTPLQSFLVPAAPNLAHVLFFAACAHVTLRGKTPTPAR
jgi:hypothetical protein